MDNKPISSFAINEIAGYFDAHLKAAKPWLATLDSVPSDMQYGPFNGSKITKIYRDLTADRRQETAARIWLHPKQKTENSYQLSRIQRLTGLDHISAKQFVIRLKDRCMRIQRDHPKLDLWVRKRVAFLEFCSKPKSIAVNDEFRDVAIGLRRSLHLAHSFLKEDRNKAEELSLKICRDALQAAGMAVHRVLTFDSTKTCKYTANLMVRVKLDGPAGPQYVPNVYAQENARIASDLWSNHCANAEHCLVVAIGTRGSDHAGFWVPLMQGNNHENIPGGPEAYETCAGASVFREDPPPLPGFSDALQHNWHGCLASKIHEPVFVSLPFVVPEGDTGSSGKRTIAILNVNANPPDDDSWDRARNSEWLTLATRYSERFTEIAYYAFQMIMASQNDSSGPWLDTGNPSWDTIPGVAAGSKLPKVFVD